MIKQPSDLKIEKVKLFDLKADPNNAREHGDINIPLKCNYQHHAGRYNH